MLCGRGKANHGRGEKNNNGKATNSNQWYVQRKGGKQDALLYATGDVVVSHETLVKFLSGPLQLVLVADAVRHSLEFARQLWGDEAVATLDFSRCKFPGPWKDEAAATSATPVTAKCKRQSKTKSKSTTTTWAADSNSSSDDGSMDEALSAVDYTTTAVTDTACSSWTYPSSVESSSAQLHDEAEEVLAPITPLAASLAYQPANLAPDSYTADLCAMLAILHSQLSSRVAASTTKPIFTTVTHQDTTAVADTLSGAEDTLPEDMNGLWPCESYSVLAVAEVCASGVECSWSDQPQEALKQPGLRGQLTASSAAAATFAAVVHAAKHRVVRCILNMVQSVLH